MKQTDQVAQLIERLGRLVSNEAHSGGLKPVQWEALRYLARANRFSRTPSAVTAYFGMTKGTVSQTLSALARKGLIKKKNCTADKRGVQLELTRAGRNQLHSDPLSKISVLSDSLAKKDNEKLASGLEHILSGLLHERDGKPFGVCKSCKHYRPGKTQQSNGRCALLDVALTPEDSELICLEQTI